MNTKSAKKDKVEEVAPPAEIDVRKEYLNNVRESFELTEEEEKLFAKLSSLRTSISGFFSMKFRIQAMKEVLEENGIVKFMSEMAKTVDRQTPVFRIKMVFTEEYLKAAKISDEAKKLLLSGNSSTVNIDKVLLEEVTKFNTSVVSNCVFSKYLQKLIDRFEQLSDEKAKQEYEKIKEVFDIVPKSVVDSFICGAIFHVRFYEDNLKTGQFEFVF